MDHKFKSVVITGASSGIGAALATRLSSEGVTLGLIARDITRLEKVSELCREKGANIVTAQIDVQQKEKLGEWLRNFDRSTPVDLLIANAGITCSLNTNKIHEPEPILSDIMNTNFTGVINTVLPVIDLMKEREQGHIAVTSSLAAYQGIPAFPAYSASKAALFNYFQAIRGRLSRSGIDLSIICPGYIDTPMTNSLSGQKMLVMPVDKAAGVIHKGLVNKKPVIAFPLIFRLALWSTTILPVRMNTAIFNGIFGIRKN